MKYLKQADWTAQIQTGWIWTYFINLLFYKWSWKHFFFKWYNPGCNVFFANWELQYNNLNMETLILCMNKRMFKLDTWSFWICLSSTGNFVCILCCYSTAQYCTVYCVLYILLHTVTLCTNVKLVLGYTNKMNKMPQLIASPILDLLDISWEQLDFCSVLENVLCLFQTADIGW